MEEAYPPGGPQRWLEEIWCPITHHHQEMEEGNVNGGSSPSRRTSGMAGRDLVPHHTPSPGDGRG